MKLLFFGSGEFGLPTLQWLHAHHQLLAVVTQPDKPAGRKRQLTATPIGQWAATQPDLDVLKFENVNTVEAIAQIADYQADASVVIAFGQKLSPGLIEAMGDLAVNLHASLLPKFRGAAPINHAMMQGETATGVSVIALAQRMDAGEVYATASMPIEPGQTAGELHDALALLGPDAIGKVLQQLQDSTLNPQVQDESLASKAPKLSKADGTVHFDQDALAVRCRVHGLTSWPGCRVQWQRQNSNEPATLILHRVEALPNDVGDPNAKPGTVLEGFRVQTASGVVRLLEVQTAGTKVMNVEDFARGHQLSVGDVLEPLASSSK